MLSEKKVKRYIRWRRKWASWFGRIEHKAGRIIALPIFAGVAYSYWVKQWPCMVLFSLTALAWIVYLTAHTCEKKIYGRLGFR